MNNLYDAVAGAMKHIRSVFPSPQLLAFLFILLQLTLTKSTPLSRGIEENLDSLVRDELFEGDIAGIGIDLQTDKGIVR